MISLTATQALLAILQITLNERLSELDEIYLSYIGSEAVNQKRLLLVPPLPLNDWVTNMGRVPVRIAQIALICNPKGPDQPRLLPIPCST